MKFKLPVFTFISACFLIYSTALANEAYGQENSQDGKAVPAILSILLDEVIPADTRLPFPDTGQNKCYSNNQEIACPVSSNDDFFGQDAQYPRIPALYTKLGVDGNVLEDNAQHIDDGGEWIMTRDDITELVWEIKTNANRTNTYTWEGAKNNFIANMNDQKFGGFSDWRLPSRAELTSLCNRAKYTPAIRMESISSLDGGDKNYRSIETFWFPNTVSFRYWSSTTVAENPDKVWRVNFNGGFAYYEEKAETYHVRAVRGPAIGHNMVDNKDGTATDKITGLKWHKCSYGQTWDQINDECTGDPLLLTWKEALAEAAKYQDWRLPNINELQSLVDDSVSEPAIYEPFRKHMVPLVSEAGDPIPEISYPYWSSTTDAQNLNRAWIINFIDGSNNYDGYTGVQGVKNRKFYIRLVSAPN